LGINERAANEGRNSLAQSNELTKRRENEMIIAVVTDDEKTISQHFGRASLYVVYTVEDGKIIGKETRPKMGHSHFASNDGPHSNHGAKHGFDADSQQKHASMAEAIKDSQVLIVGGMGIGAYESMKSYKIESIITDVTDIDEAVKLYVEGKLPNLINKLH
jgi:predicted Fe-Mo cluster-binding NifX family protein